VVRDNGGHQVALKWSMFNLYGVAPGELWWCGSDIGWVVGHSYIIYGPLLHGATSVMYGQADRHARRRRVLAGDRGHKAVALFTAPTAFRAIRRKIPRQIHPPIRSFKIPHAVSGRRARRSRRRWNGRKRS
jgi:propionyl-CoA synthetase